MSAKNIVLQKVTNILIWDDTNESQQIFIIDIKDSIVFSQKTGGKIGGLRGTIIVENRCGKAGLPEILKILSDLDWNEIVSFILITNNISQIRKIDKKIASFMQGQGDTYGIDPDYYFSLVPIKGANHKRIENFILSLKNRCSTMAKIKYFIKKMMVSLNWSNLLYEQYVFCFYRDIR